MRAVGFWIGSAMMRATRNANGNAKSEDFRKKSNDFPFVIRLTPTPFDAQIRMRFRLRTLLIVLGVGPPMLALVFWEAKTFGWTMLPVYAAAFGIAVTVLALTVCSLWLAKTK